MMLALDWDEYDTGQRQNIRKTNERGSGVGGSEMTGNKVMVCLVARKTCAIDFLDFHLVNR